MILLRITSLILLLAVGQIAMAFDYFQTVYPSDPSTVDEIVLGGAGPRSCLNLIPSSMIEIHTTGTANEGSPDASYSHEMTINTVGSVCSSPPVFLYEGIRIGSLPEGRHTITEKYVTDGEIVSEDTTTFSVRKLAGPSVSGAWYSPQQSGRGVFILRMPLHDGQYAGENLFSVYWATHDAAGNSNWALMTGLMSDNVVSGTAVNTTGSPLAPGPADLNQSVWGNVSFAARRHRPRSHLDRHQQLSRRDGGILRRSLAAGVKTLETPNRATPSRAQRTEDG